MKRTQKLIFFLFLFSSGFIVDISAQGIEESIKKDFENYKSKISTERVFLVTDRDIYTPGESVWFSAVAYKSISPIVSKVTDAVTLRLLNSELEIVFEDSYDMVDGRLNSHLLVPTDMLGGIYYLQCLTDHSSESSTLYRKILVKEKVLPAYIINFSFPDKEYLAGDNVPISLMFKDVFNNPTKNVSYHVSFFDGNSVISEFEGKTKKDGLGSLEFKMPNSFSSGIITYQVSAESKGIEADLNGILQAMPSDINVDYFPENGRLIEGLSSTVHVFAYYNLGQPAAIEADILKDGEVVSSVVSEQNGMGSFELLPDINSKYEIRINKPVNITKPISFPDIAERGIGLKLESSSKGKLQYKLMNGYESSRLVYLVGVSDEDIFWFSEHEIDEQVIVDVDVSSATGVAAHFIAINAASRIEGEHFVSIKGEDEKVKLSSITAETPGRSSTEPSVSITDNQEGELLIKVVNSPWLLEGINNPNPTIISLPGDASQQEVIRYYGSLKMNDNLVEALIPYYNPIELGWDKVLKTKGCFGKHEKNKDVERYQKFIDQFAGKYMVIKGDGNLTHSNLICGEAFVLENPKFVESVETEKPAKIPAYKKLLERGNVPMIDVLNTIKPCKLVGGGIQVFSTNAGMSGGTASSLIVIDGVPRGYDAALLTGMNPRSIDKIRISTQPTDIMKYAGFNTSAVIEVVTKKGEDKTKPAVKIDKSLQFSSPDYEKRKGGDEDFRSTIFWGLDNVDGSKENYSFKYYNSDLVSEVEGRIYYFPNIGAPSSINFNYTVK